MYAVMWVGHSQDWGWLHSFDWSLLNAAHDIGIKNPAWVRFWDGVSLILGPVVLRPLGLLAAMVALAKRKIRIALLLLACLPLNAIMTDRGQIRGPPPATGDCAGICPFDFVSVRACVGGDRKRTRAANRPVAHAAQQVYSAHRHHGGRAVRVDGRCCQGGVERASSDRRCCRLGAGVPVFPRVPVRISTAVDIRCPTRVSCFVAASGGVETTRTGSRHGPLKPWCAVHFALSPHSDPAGF
ncbi:putative integral membrane protein [Mycobacterium tuberculosis RGTB423]|nr:putative integral membrane protein [Mycobacterium tuberculosis RGTB423]